MATRYDAIVLGLGGIGSAVLSQLAERGVRVLGIEQFSLVHDRGSSHGDTRVIRLAYFEHPDYVPLLRRSWELWRELETKSGRGLLFPVGLLEVGPPDGEVIPGVLASALQHGLQVERLSDRQRSRRFPGFSVPPDCEAVFEAEAGYLLVEKCVETQLDLARSRGATITAKEAVIQWHVDGERVFVQTTAREYEAEQLVITAGAWAGPMMPGLDIDFEIRRQHLHWFNNTSPHYRSSANCPTFLFELPSGIYYGFPEVSAHGHSAGSLKVGRHDQGERIIDPSSLSRAVDSAELASTQGFVRDHLPHATTDPVGHAVCMYTMTPDGHFVVDRHPYHANVLFAAGLSGHGFKFAPVLGECLAQMVVGEQVSLPIGFLGLNRFR